MSHLLVMYDSVGILGEESIEYLGSEEFSEVGIIFPKYLLEVANILDAIMSYVTHSTSPMNRDIILIFAGMENPFYLLGFEEKSGIMFLKGCDNEILRKLLQIRTYMDRYESYDDTSIFARPTVFGDDSKDAFCDIRVGREREYRWVIFVDIEEYLRDHRTFPVKINNQVSLEISWHCFIFGEDN